MIKLGKRIVLKPEIDAPRALLLLLFILFTSVIINAQTAPSKSSEKISQDLLGLFFENINYSSGGRLYAELVQNRSFEDKPTERKERHPMSYWEYTNSGYWYGQVNIETANPVHPANAHYAVFNAEHISHVSLSVIRVKTKQ